MAFKTKSWSSMTWMILGTPRGLETSIYGWCYKYPMTWEWPCFLGWFVPDDGKVNMNTVLAGGSKSYPILGIAKGARDTSHWLFQQPVEIVGVGVGGYGYGLDKKDSGEDGFWSFLILFVGAKLMMVSHSFKCPIRVWRWAMPLFKSIFLMIPNRIEATIYNKFVI